MKDWKNEPWDATVCHCLRIDKQMVVDEILNGNTTTAGIEKKVGAGMGCGMCIPDVQELINIYGGDKDGPSCCGSGHC